MKNLDISKFVKRIVATASKPYDFGADKLKATTAPTFFIHGDMGPRSTSRVAILPDTTHVTLMQRMSIIVPLVNDFLDAKP